MQIVYFLGRFHVLVLHLPLGILTLAVALEFLVRLRRFGSLRALLAPLWLAGALSAIATVALGFMHATEGAFAGSSGVEAHRWSGVLLALVASAVAVLRVRASLATRLSHTAWMLGAAVTGALLVITGHLGGALTHGETYLLEYAPATLQELAGSAKQARSKPRDFASADLYLDVVAPALERRCATCHNDRKRGGKLSIVTYEALMKGGEDGPVIVPRDVENSDLLRRVSLAKSDEDFMPKEGKTPLTEEEVEAIGIWVRLGAPRLGPMSALALDENAASRLRRILGFAGGALPTGSTGSGSARVRYDENEALPSVDPAPQQIVTALEAAGFVVRPIAQGSNLLDVDYSSPPAISRAQLDLLQRAAPQILRLNLRRAGLDDGSLRSLAGMTNLRHLRLEENRIGDAGVRELAALKALRYLNLFGTRITDASLETIRGFEHLHEFYVWNSSVSTKGLTSLHAARPALTIENGRVPAQGQSPR